MIDHGDTLLAFRNRAIALEVCTTGSQSLSATMTGYARQSGSFLADGFYPGMELVAAGFSIEENNGAAVVTDVAALTISIMGGRKVELAGSGRSLVVGIPALRAWENVRFKPEASRHYIEEDFAVGSNQQISAPYNGGTDEEEGLYILRWYGLANTASIGLWKSIDALLRRFAKGTVLSVGSNTVRVRGDVGPRATQPTPNGKGHAVSSISIPWKTWTTNAVFA